MSGKTTPELASKTLLKMQKVELIKIINKQSAELISLRRDLKDSVGQFNKAKDETAHVKARLESANGIIETLRANEKARDALARTAAGTAKREVNPAKVVQPGPDLSNIAKAMQEAKQRAMESGEITKVKREATH